MALLTHLIAELLVNFVILISLSLIVSNTSALSIGHLAFFGSGALAAGFAFELVSPQYSLVAALILACAVAAALGSFIATATLRLREDHFLVLSVAVLQVVYGISLAWKGPSGFNGLTRPVLGSWRMEADWRVIVALLMPCAVLAALVFVRFGRLPLKRACAAVRTHESFAALLGISPFFMKTGCFVLAATMAAIAGVLSTVYVRGTDPNQITLDKSLILFATLLLGGLNTVSGAALASLFFTLIPIMFETVLGGSTFSAFYGAQLRQLFFGALLLLIIRQSPRGLSEHTVLGESE